MFRNILEDLILLALVGVALYLVYTKWLAKYFGSAAAAVDAQIKLQKESVNTIKEAAASPSAVLSDLWSWASTPYISQADFRSNIETIKAGLK